MSIFSTGLSIVISASYAGSEFRGKKTGWVRKGMTVNTVSFVHVYPPFSPISPSVFCNIFVASSSQLIVTFTPFFPFAPMAGNVHKDRISQDGNSLPELIYYVYECTEVYSTLRLHQQLFSLLIKLLIIFMINGARRSLQTASFDQPTV